MLKFHVHSLAACGASVVLAVATALAATPAPAAVAKVETRSVVSYRDLDLTRPQDVAALKRRIADAADRVCAPAPGLAINERQAHRTCVTAARSGGHAQLRNAEVAAREARGLTTASR